MRLFCALMVFALPNVGCAAVTTVSLGVKQLEAGGCQAVNEAIASLPAEGGRVRLPEGTFACDAPILIDRDHVTVEGAGRSKTFLKVRDAQHPVPLLIIGSIRNRFAGPYHLPYPDHQTVDVTVRGLDLDGGFRFPARPGENDLECWSPETGKSRNCGSDAGYLIRNNGITLRGAEQIRVQDVASHGNYSGGIVTEKICKDVVLDGIDLYENYFDGFAGYETTGSRIDHFLVRDNGFSGVSLDAEFEHNVFDHGSIYGNKDNGIFSVNVGRNTFIHMELSRNGNYGIFVDNFRTSDGKGTVGNCDGVKILDSVVDMTGEANSHSAIRFGYACRGVEIRGVRSVQKGFDCLSGTEGMDLAVSDSTCSDGRSERPLQP